MNKFIKDTMFAILVSICTVYILYRMIKRPQKILPKKENAILITGCDSGIGYSLACYCHDIGITVFAGCLNTNSLGSSNLQKLQDVYVIELDVRNIQNIHSAAAIINNILKENSSIGKNIFIH